MTPVDQTIFYDPKAPPEKQRGNCLTAVVASLLDLSIESVPNFVQDDVDHEGTEDAADWDWWARLHRFAREHDHEIIYLRAKGQAEVFPEPKPGEFYAVVGISPRDSRIHHIVIYKDDQMVHDPHPDRTGLTKVTDEWHWTMRPVKETSA